MVQWVDKQVFECASVLRLITLFRKCAAWCCIHGCYCRRIAAGVLFLYCMEAIKFSEKIIVNAKQEFLFDYTQDYNNRLTWDTFLQKAVLMAAATKAEKGVKAYCVSKNGLGMETEYVSFNRPRVTAVKMTRGPFLFKAFLGSWTFKALAADTTEVTFLYSFKLRFPFTIFRRFITANLRKNVQQRLRDLKGCTETARPV